MDKTYTYKSNWEFTKSILFRLGLLCLIAYLCYHYDENPTIIVILCILCLALFLITGNDEILITYKTIKLIDTSVISSFTKSQKIYELNKIKRAYLPEKEKWTVVNLFAIIFLLLIFQNKGSRQSTTYPIYLEMIDGKIIQINTTLEEDKRIAIVKRINSLV